MLLRLQSISKSYGPVQANRAVDLDVAEASIHAVLGENGAGKSTLMKLISGVEQPDGGTILWRGQPVALTSPLEARRLGIGMVFQHFSLFETLTVTQNVALTVPGPRAAIAARIRALGESFGLEVDPAALVQALSVGERQRVEIIRALMLDPKLLILDEPTSVLPPQSVTRLFETLRRLRAGGVSILFISHKLDEIRALCDDATVLRGGRVTGRVDPRRTPSAELARLMIGGALPAVPPGRQSRPGAPMLEIRGLDAAPDDPFGLRLRGIDLTVRAGEVVGIAGISGNGQAALIAAISGEAPLPHAQADRVRMMGRPVGALDAGARRALGFAFVPEERLGRGAVPSLSLADNALLTAHRQPGLIRRGLIDRARLKALAARIIADCDVRTSGPQAEAGALSGGNLQKFIVGREIAQDPRLLLVAQPTWGVDIGAATAIRRRLVALRDAGVAVLVLSEELDELFDISDRLHVLHGGLLSPALDPATTTPDEVGRWMTGGHDADPPEVLHAV